MKTSRPAAERLLWQLDNLPGLKKEPGRQMAARRGREKNEESIYKIGRPDTMNRPAGAPFVERKVPPEAYGKMTERLPKSHLEPIPAGIACCLGD
ncbi:uncharacterized protein Dvar_31390 [Desulfosarcina variabilis str. Montpellier]